MKWRPGEQGYGLVTKVLHWVIVVLLAAQFVVGHAMTGAEGLLEPLVEARFDGDEEALLGLHVVLGVAILLLALVRLCWRLAMPLPPWAPGLSPLERRVSHVVERVLYATMFLIPLTGIGLLLLSGEDWQMGPGREFVAPLEVADDDLWLLAHIATHVVFFVALMIHVGSALFHQFVRRDRLVNRML